jgi:[protein-PII] uridylyltransferase
MLPRMDVGEAVSGSPAEQLRTARDEVIASVASGAALRDALTALCDRWLADQLGDEPAVALVAVGGYGRRELLPGSDLDVVLLHRDLRNVKTLADRIWYPIWDAKVSLDHSVRSVAEAIAVAREDLKAVLGLLDARHVAGDPALTDELRSAVLTDWRRDARKRLPAVDASNRERAEQFGELAFLLEPDLKEARGGLRDVQAMFAAAAAWVVDPPGERVRAARDRLLDVRTELHRRARATSQQRRVSSANDRLVLQEQGPVGAALGYADADDLMKDVYEAARAVAFGSYEVWRRVHESLRTARRW